jgi:YebC/PmpR family DNA-binding regulatory protein
MSGHSKWANIKTRKESQDRKRAQVATKLLRAISVAAREGGPNPEANPKLRFAIDRARSFNISKETIERAIRREGSENIEPFTIDAIGPSGVSLVIEGATDNRNRTIGEIRHILGKHEGKLAEGEGARWAFTRRGIIAIERGAGGLENDAITLAAIEGGAEDIRETDEGLEIVVPPELLESCRRHLIEQGITVADATIGWIPQHLVTLSANTREKLNALLSELEQHPDIHVVWSNEGEDEETNE